MTRRSTITASSGRAWIYGLRGGISYQAWPVLTAELAVGYGTRRRRTMTNSRR